MQNSLQIFRRNRGAIDVRQAADGTDKGGDVSFRIGDRVRLIKRPEVTGTVHAVGTLACTVRYDGDMIPPADAHFHDHLELLTLGPSSGSVSKSCECGLDSTYGMDHSFGHADYCPKS